MELEITLQVRHKGSKFDLLMGQGTYTAETEVQALRALSEFCAVAIANAEKDKIFKPPSGDADGRMDQRIL